MLFRSEIAIPNDTFGDKVVDCIYTANDDTIYIVCLQYGDDLEIATTDAIADVDYHTLILNLKKIVIGPLTEEDGYAADDFDFAAANNLLENINLQA